MQRCSPASRGATPRHRSPLTPTPWTNTIGGPAPVLAVLDRPGGRFDGSPLSQCVADGHRGNHRLSAELRRAHTVHGVESLHPPEHVADLYRLSDPGLSDLGLEALLDELLVRIREILDVDTAAILLLDEDLAALVPRAADGLEGEVGSGLQIPIGKGFAGRVAAERAPVAISNLEEAEIVNPILRERGVQSLLGVPLVVEGALIGVLTWAARPRQFVSEDAIVLELAAARAAPSIERARLYDALEGEHRGAVALQRSLLPERLPDLAEAMVAARYLPATATQVGGDWYDVITLPHGRIGLVIGDVAGHGVRSATLMGQRAHGAAGLRAGEPLARGGARTARPDAARHARARRWPR